ncbi:MAG: 3-keto-5-aminohexanoate cleavage protein, partial [Anaerolineae bacterium]|nr:3-keto-5-aminohexanoate cleavage protein [Anaerolineae bacterium]NIN97334.1 3-keto-5-aminohexanoate cleavage protein [Anaerolineae bacterium]NIQ80257.1 3-keto-5-aminohexanoate cleavage protein [Anaerolineae bacterium]
MYLRRGVLAKNNAELVEIAVRLVHQLQREVATP